MGCFSFVTTKKASFALLKSVNFLCLRFFALVKSFLFSSSIREKINWKEIFYSEDTFAATGHEVTSIEVNVDVN